VSESVLGGDGGVGNDGDGPSGGLEADGGLEGVVDPPLEAGERADHNDTGAETAPEAGEADLGVDLADVGEETAFGLGGVDLGDDGVGGVGDDGAEDTGDVAGHEGDGELLGLGVLVLGAGEDLGVEEIADFLEGDELHDGVGDLARPEGDDALVEAAPALLGLQLAQGGRELVGEGAGLSGLHSDLNGLPRAKQQVGDDFSGAGGD